MFAYRNVQRAVRDDRWKLIRYPQVDKTQLFDLQNDPDELKDLSADPAHAPTSTECSPCSKSGSRKWTTRSP